MLCLSPGTQAQATPRRKEPSQVPWSTKVGLQRTVFHVGSGSSGYDLAHPPPPSTQVGTVIICPRSSLMERLQCDLKLESCGQCQRAKISCQGYRNLQDLVFRDETDAARHKVLARSGYYPAEASGCPLPMWDLDLDMSTRCREIFFSLYVAGLSRSYTSLVPLYTQAPASGHLACSVDAVSLAFTAVQFETQELMSLANKRYVVAIQNLGQALQNPKVLESDEILQSVLLLDVYEKLSNRKAHTAPSWMSHIQGAMSLVSARGSLNFSN